MAALSNDEMREMFDDPGFEVVHITQMSPSGKHVIASVVFRVCPVCAATVPGEVEGRDFAAQHRDWHLDALMPDPVEPEPETVS